MYRLAPIALFLFLFLSHDTMAQRGGDTVRSTRPRLPVARADRTPPPVLPSLARMVWPLAGKYSFGSGIGVEYSLLPEMSVELNTMFVAHSAKARFFMVGKDVSPFLSAGFGVADERFGRRGVSGRWIEAQAGVERALDQAFMRVQLHYTINQTAGLGWPQFAPDFTIGYRF